MQVWLNKVLRKSLKAHPYKTRVTIEATIPRTTFEDLERFRKIQLILDTNPKQNNFYGFAIQYMYQDLLDKGVLPK